MYHSGLLSGNCVEGRVHFLYYIVSHPTMLAPIVLLFTDLSALIKVLLEKDSTLLFIHVLMIILIRLRELIDFITRIISFIWKRIHLRVKRRAWLVSVWICFDLWHFCQSFPFFTTVNLTITFNFKMAVWRDFFTFMIIYNSELLFISVEIVILIKGNIWWIVTVFIFQIHILLY